MSLDAEADLGSLAAGDGDGFDEVARVLVQRAAVAEGEGGGGGLAEVRRLRRDLHGRGALAVLGSRREDPVRAAEVALAVRGGAREDGGLARAEAVHREGDGLHEVRVGLERLAVAVVPVGVALEIALLVGKPELANHPSLPAIVDTAFVMTDEDESGDITLEEAAKTQEQISTMLGNFMAGELEGTEL